jgi:hypothetical protein
VDRGLASEVAVGQEGSRRVVTALRAEGGEETLHLGPLRGRDGQAMRAIEAQPPGEVGERV